MDSKEYIELALRTENKNHGDVAKDYSKTKTKFSRLTTRSSQLSSLTG